MAGTTVSQQPPEFPTLQANQVQATGDYDADEEVLQEEAVIKDTTGDVDASATQHTNHQSETSKEKMKILEWS